MRLRMNEDNKDNYFQMIYTSRTAPQLTEKGLIDILIAAQQYNINKGVSGFLSYGTETLIQLIEGNEFNVKNLYQKIKKDSRHMDMTVQHFGFTVKRCMPFLGMGLCFMEESNQHVHQFYFTRHEAKNFSALINGDIGKIFGKYLDNKTQAHELSDEPKKH